MQGLACARQVQNKPSEASRVMMAIREHAGTVVGERSGSPMGILKSTREFKAPGAGKEHTSAVRGGVQDPGVRSPGSGLGRPTARSKFFFFVGDLVKFFPSKNVKIRFKIRGTFESGHRVRNPDRDAESCHQELDKSTPEGVQAKDRVYKDPPALGAVRRRRTRVRGILFLRLHRLSFPGKKHETMRYSSESIFRGRFRTSAESGMPLRSNKKSLS